MFSAQLNRKVNTNKTVRFSPPRLAEVGGIGTGRHQVCGTGRDDVLLSGGPGPGGGGSRLGAGGGGSAGGSGRWLGATGAAVSGAIVLLLAAELMPLLQNTWGGDRDSVGYPTQSLKTVPSAFTRAARLNQQKALFCWNGDKTAPVTVTLKI